MGTEIIVSGLRRPGEGMCMYPLRILLYFRAVSFLFQRGGCCMYFVNHKRPMGEICKDEFEGYEWDVEWDGLRVDGEWGDLLCVSFFFFSLCCLDE